MLKELNSKMTIKEEDLFDLFEKNQKEIKKNNQTLLNDEDVKTQKVKKSCEIL